MTDKDQDTLLAYRMMFSSPTGITVMNDLMAFCNFRKEVQSDIDEGKRRVFLRILELSQLTDDQLIALYAGRLMTMERQDD